MTDDLVTRLRDHAFVNWTDAMERAADRIEALEAENATLRTELVTARETIQRMFLDHADVVRRTLEEARAAESAKIATMAISLSGAEAPT